MQSPVQPTNTDRYAKTVAVSKRIRWDIDKDVIRGRKFDFSKKFLPDGLSKVGELAFLSDADKRLLSQIQGRSYAGVFGLVERFIAAKVLEVSRDYWLGDQTALEALIRFGDEELKHQELFRRIEGLVGAGMPAGYSFLPEPNAVASIVLGKSNWAVLALTLLIELFTQQHYRESIDPDTNLSELWKDVFLFHWKEESQHAIIDELEWIREDAQLTPDARDQGVTELIELVRAVDGILQGQAAADADYFFRCATGTFSDAEREQVHNTVLKAYRWQYIVSGVQKTRFGEILGNLIDATQGARIGAALEPILNHVNAN